MSERGVDSTNSPSLSHPHHSSHGCVCHCACTPTLYVCAILTLAVLPQRRAVSSSVRSLATTSSPPPIASTSAAAATAAQPHRPRLDALRAEQATIDDFVGDQSGPSLVRDKVVFTKNKT